MRANEEITAAEVRLVGVNGEAVGVVRLSEALEAARAANLDLVEVSPKAEPPVCKIMDHGKYRYEQQKKKNEAKKKQKTIEIKEIQIRPAIDKHDLEVKMKAVNRFLKSGDKVKFTMRFRGREISHQTLGLDVLNKIIEMTADMAKVESPPKLEGKQYSMTLASLKLAN
ncbi:translation initiation factor IF-3 [Alphaproteobacteria bacterium]|nr:translation initiation factor IF-3 [Alphaproteobacteria bacterium]GHS97040.1 translation initiation factor IF-3 [Alphaproteobacteria bacterium]